MHRPILCFIINKYCCCVTGNSGVPSDVSHHPPHLLDSRGSWTPNALIPFCSYQTNLTILGQNNADFPFTFCSKFQPTVLEGQLCYKINIVPLTINNVKPGEKNSLMMIIDPGQTFTNQQTPDVQNLKFVNLEPAHTSSSVRVYIDILGSFSDSRPGSFAMYSLKKMTGTEGFLNLPTEKKKCQVETYELCQNRNYITEVQTQCGCVPWTLNKTLTEKVGLQSIEKNCNGNQFLFYRNLPSVLQRTMTATQQFLKSPLVVVYPALASTLM